MWSSSRALGFSCIMAVGLSTWTAKCLLKKAYLKTEFKTPRLPHWMDYWTIFIKKQWSSTINVSRYPILPEKAEMDDRALPYWQCCGFAAWWVWVPHAAWKETSFLSALFQCKPWSDFVKAFLMPERVRLWAPKPLEIKVTVPNISRNVDGLGVQGCYRFHSQSQGRSTDLGHPHERGTYRRRWRVKKTSEE